MSEVDPNFKTKNAFELVKEPVCELVSRVLGRPEPPRRFGTRVGAADCDRYDDRDALRFVPAPTIQFPNTVNLRRVENAGDKPRFSLTHAVTIQNFGDFFVSRLALLSPVAGPQARRQASAATPAHATPDLASLPSPYVGPLTPGTAGRAGCDHAAARSLLVGSRLERSQVNSIPPSRPATLLLLRSDARQHNLELVSPPADPAEWQRPPLLHRLAVSGGANVDTCLASVDCDLGGRLKSGQ